MFLQLENSEVSLQAHFFRLVNITQGMFFLHHLIHFLLQPSGS